MKRTLFGFLMLLTIVCTSSVFATDATEKQFLNVATEVNGFDFDGVVVDFTFTPSAILANGFDFNRAVYPLIEPKPMHRITLEFDSGLFPLPREFVRNI